MVDQKRGQERRCNAFIGFSRGSQATKVSAWDIGRIKHAVELVQIRFATSAMDSTGETCVQQVVARTKWRASPRLLQISQFAFNPERKGEELAGGYRLANHGAPACRSLGALLRGAHAHIPNIPAQIKGANAAF